MNVPKPYIFWLVSAAVCVVLLIVGFLLEPTHEGDTVQEVVEDLNRQYTKLGELAGKARNDIPSYPTNDPQIFESLKDDTLITRRWESGLARLKQDYEEQVAGIRQDLLARSRPLLEPISDAVDKADWYFEYMDTTGEWLEGLHRDGLVELKRRGGFGVVTDDQSFTLEDFRTRSDLRNTVGLFTNDQTEYPDSGIWPTLTRQFRVLEQFARALRQSSSTAKVNPAILDDQVPAPAATGVRLLEVKWAGGGGGVSSEVSIPGGRATECSLKVRGSPSAIVAFCAELDAEVEPMITLRGVTWSQPNSGGQVEANPADTPFEATVHLTILRFTEDGLAAIGQQGEG